MTLSFLRDFVFALPGIVTFVAQLFSPVMSSPADFQAPFRPHDLVTEYKENPIGIDVVRPRLSWKISSTDRGWQQSAYQLQVAESIDQLVSGGQLIWDSAKVTSGGSVHREYAGPRALLLNFPHPQNYFDPKQEPQQPGESVRLMVFQNDRHR